MYGSVSDIGSTLAMAVMCAGAAWPQASDQAQVHGVLVSPPGLEDLYAVHHCKAIDESLRLRFGEEFAPFQYHMYGTHPYLLGWCTRDSAAAKSPHSFVLVMRFGLASDPLRQCSDEIANVVRMGRLDVLEPRLVSTAMFPLRFLDTNEPVRLAKPFTANGIASQDPEDNSVELFVCVNGRWAHITNRPGGTARLKIGPAAASPAV
jgi:hypothetical protein